MVFGAVRINHLFYLSIPIKTTCKVYTNNNKTTKIEGRIKTKGIHLHLQDLITSNQTGNRHWIGFHSLRWTIFGFLLKKQISHYI